MPSVSDSDGMDGRIAMLALRLRGTSDCGLLTEVLTMAAHTGSKTSMVVRFAVDRRLCPSEMPNAPQPTSGVGPYATYATKGWLATPLATTMMEVCGPVTPAGTSTSTI